jgi:hypothetical protein
MRSKNSLTSVAFAALVLAVGAALPTGAAPPDNPCSLLTQSQVSAALGVSVDPGRQNTTGLITCTWIQANSGNSGGTAFTLRQCASLTHHRFVLVVLIRSPENNLKALESSISQSQHLLRLR